MQILEKTIHTAGLVDNPMIVAVQMGKTDFAMNSMFRLLHIRVATENGIKEYHTATNNNEVVVMDVASAFKAEFTDDTITPDDVLMNESLYENGKRGVIQIYTTQNFADGHTEQSASVRRVVYGLRGGIDGSKRFTANSEQPYDLIKSLGMLSTKPDAVEVVGMGDCYLVPTILLKPFQNLIKRSDLLTAGSANLPVVINDTTYLHCIGISVKVVDKKVVWTASETLPNDIQFTVVYNGVNYAIQCGEGLQQGTSQVIGDIGNKPFPGTNGVSDSTVVWSEGVRYDVKVSNAVPVSTKKTAKRVLSRDIAIQVEPDGNWFASEPLPCNVVLRVTRGSKVINKTLKAGEYEGRLAPIYITFDVASQTWKSSEPLPQNVVVALANGGTARTSILRAGQSEGALFDVILFTEWKIEDNTFSWKSARKLDEELTVSIPAKIKEGETPDEDFADYLLCPLAKASAGAFSGGKYELTSLPALPTGIHNYTTEPLSGNPAIMNTGGADVVESKDTPALITKVEVISKAKDVTFKEKLQTIDEFGEFGYTEFNFSQDDLIRKVFVEDNPDRHQFFFINSFGMLETASAVCYESKQKELSTTEYNRVQEPGFRPSSFHSADVTSKPDTWAMSTGFISREWAEWWTTEFLKSKKHWLRLSDGTILPVSIKPNNKYTLYNKATADMNSIGFTVISNIEGKFDL